MKWKMYQEINSFNFRVVHKDNWPQCLCVPQLEFCFKLYVSPESRTDLHDMYYYYCGELKIL